MSERSLPDFLVIGAMKAGTTTLYHDLASQTAIRMSEVKEPSVLLRFPDPEHAIGNYARQFAGRRSGQILGEASTEYSKLPRHQGVARRARDLLGSDLRLIYLVRNPVERAVSHHHHAFSRGRQGADIDETARSDSTLVDFGRYAMQLEPWIESFGLDRILVLRFEDYVRDRAAALRKVGQHLGVSVDPSRIPEDKAFNQSEGNRIGTKARIGPLLRSDLYQLGVRRLIPDRLRLWLRDKMVPEAPPRPTPPRPDTVDLLIERLAPDADRLASLLGWPAPVWDFAATRTKYASRA
jgi:hypothetical protein